MMNPLDRRSALARLAFGGTLPLWLAGGQANAGLLPVLEDLEPRWNQVAIGMTVEQVLAVMVDAPDGREQSEWLSLRVDDLVWRDLRTHYRARFLANKVYAKTLTRHPNSLFALNPSSPWSQP